MKAWPLAPTATVWIDLELDDVVVDWASRPVASCSTATAARSLLCMIGDGGGGRREQNNGAQIERKEMGTGRKERQKAGLHEFWQLTRGKAGRGM